jgi:kynurenine formamidase
MFIDLSLPISTDQITGGDERVRKIIDAGHAGTHFDVMDKVFPLEKFKTRGKVIDISHIRDRDVEIADLGDTRIEKDDFVIFHSGWVDQLGYDIVDEYLYKSAELSDDLVRHLIEAGVSLIGVDAAGAQPPKKHPAVDQYCADNGVFIIENLNNVKRLFDLPQPFTIYTAPLNRTDLSGLPCRVLVEVE